MAGWVKIYRQITASQVFANAELLKVWIYCLCRANHREAWASVSTGKGQTEIKLKPGQFIFGRNKTAQELSMKPSSVRNRMEKLKKMRNLDIQTSGHYSIVSICNWEAYQAGEFDDKNKSGQPQDNQRTGKGQPKDTDKNVKNEKNKPCRVFLKFWNETNGCNLRMTEAKKRQINARLKTFTAEEIKTAIRNRASDSWINGEGLKHKTSWESFWRNDEKVERYLNIQGQQQPEPVIDGGTF